MAYRCVASRTAPLGRDARTRYSVCPAYRLWWPAAHEPTMRSSTGGGSSRSSVIGIVVIVGGGGGEGAAPLLLPSPAAADGPPTEYFRIEISSTAAACNRQPSRCIRP